MTQVTVYVDGKVIGSRSSFGDAPSEYLDIAEEIMTEKKVDHCAIRIEDENKQGCWMMVGGKNGDRPRMGDKPNA